MLTRRHFLSTSGALAVAACAPRTPVTTPGASAPGTAAVSARGFAGPPRGWGDRDPFDWPGRSPSAYPVHGTNVSRWNGSIDWSHAGGQGLSFAWIKATEGGDLVDPLFAEHWNRAADAGVARGAFHFWYHCRGGAEQARWFIANVPRQPGSLPPVLDMEWTPFSPTCTIRPPAEETRREMRIFLRIVEEHYGTRPLIYVVPDFFDDNDLASFTGYEWWLRSTAAHPTDRYPGTPYRVWQYSGTGTIPGIASLADRNAFNGSPEAFRSWIAQRQVR